MLMKILGFTSYGSLLSMLRRLHNPPACTARIIYPKIDAGEERIDTQSKVSDTVLLRGRMPCYKLVLAGIARDSLVLEFTKAVDTLDH